jgi:2-polyprenyl-6-hydroxyphenyl methylase/3-demethylubiquinone-9 3-methyltransferase
LIELNKFVPLRGTIIEIGCGFGLLSNILAISSSDRMVRGIDISEKRIIAAAKTIKNRKNIKFIRASADSGIKENENNAIVICDTLYLFSHNKQKELLELCHGKLVRNGVLLIKDVAQKPFWKFWVVLFQEMIIVRFLKFTFSEEKRLFFRHVSDYEYLLKGMGFDVEIKRMDRRYLCPHVAYICRKL